MVSPFDVHVGDEKRLTCHGKPEKGSESESKELLLSGTTGRTLCECQGLHEG